MFGLWKCTSPYQGVSGCAGRRERATLASRTATVQRRWLLALKLHVELIYDPGCPNVASTREVLTHALQEAGMPAVWTEWSSEDPRCPESARGLGSPSVLVNGEDVAPGPHPWAQREPGAGPRCRVYEDEDGKLVPVPPLTRVARAIADAVGPDVG